MLVSWTLTLSEASFKWIQTFFYLKNHASFCVQLVLSASIFYHGTFHHKYDWIFEKLFSSVRNLLTTQPLEKQMRVVVRHVKWQLLQKNWSRQVGRRKIFRSDFLNKRLSGSIWFIEGLRASKVCAMYKEIKVRCFT